MGGHHRRKGLCVGRVGVSAIGTASCRRLHGHHTYAFLSTQSHTTTSPRIRTSCTHSPITLMTGIAILQSSAAYEPVMRTINSPFHTTTDGELHSTEEFRAAVEEYCAKMQPVDRQLQLQVRNCWV